MKKLGYICLLLFISVMIPLISVEAASSYTGDVTINIGKTVVTNDNDYSFTISSSIKEVSSGKKLKNTERYLQVAVYVNNEKVSDEKIQTNQDKYTYTLPTSSYKNKATVKISTILYTSDNKNIAQDSATLTLKSNKKYQELIIEADDTYDWNTLREANAEVPISLYYINAVGKKKAFTTRNMISVKASDGKTYTLTKVKDSKNEYIIKLQNDIVTDSTLTLTLSYKNTNVTTSSKMITVTKRHEDTINKITLNNDSATVDRGKKLQLNPIIEPTDSKENITWSSSDENIATVNSNGVITGVNKGSATISAKGKYASTSIKVNVKAILNKIAINGDYEIEVGDTATIDYRLSPKDADIDKLTFSSSDNKITEIDDSGKITAIREGKTTITISYEDISAEKEITVIPKLEAISVEKTEIGLVPNEEYQINITTKPDTYEKAFQYTYTTSNEDVCTVDGSGKITAVGIGESTVTISHKNVKTTILVKVNALESAFKLKKNIITINKDVELSSIIEGSLDGISVSIEDTSIAIYEDGVIIPLKDGETLATITKNSTASYLNIEVNASTEKEDGSGDVVEDVDEIKTTTEDLTNNLLYILKTKATNKKYKSIAELWWD